MSAVVNAPRLGRRTLWGSAAVLVLAVAVGGWYGWLWYTTPRPPKISLEGLDPEVATAIGAAVERVRKEGRSAAAWGALGQLLLAHDDIDHANECFAQAGRLDPSNPRWPYYQGLTRTARNPADAIPFLRRAVELCAKYDAGNMAPRLLLAETLFQTEAQQEAADQLNRVCLYDPYNPRVQYDLGVLAVGRQDDESAVPYFTAAAKSSSARQKSCSALAAIRQRQGDAAGAARYRGLAAAPPEDDPWDDDYVKEYLSLQTGRRARLNEIEELKKQGRMEEALTLLRDMAKDGTDGHVQIAAGIVLLQLGRLDEAEHYFRAAGAGTTEMAQANYFLAVVLCGEAAQLRQGPGDGAARAQAKYKEAVECAERSLELSPDNVMTHFYHGQALAGLGRKKESIESYRQAALLHPEMVETHLALGKALADDDQKAEAVVELQHASDLAAPGDLRPRDMLAKVRGDMPK